MRFCDPKSPRGEAAEGAENPSRPPPLGKVALSVDQNDGGLGYKARRKLNFRHLKTAGELLPKERVRLCRWAMISASYGVDVALNTYRREDGTSVVRAGFRGLQLCGSVWHCPCCGERISETRRGELNRLLTWARGQKLIPLMLTLTASHQRGNDLRAQLKGMKGAKQRLRQRREWRALKSSIVGTVTATEVTHGGAGWHTHFHEILLVKAEDEAAALRLFSGMASVWVSCLKGFGMDATLTRGFRLQGAGAAGGYVAKWGAASELTLSGQKSGKTGGRTPRQLLAAAHEGDVRAGRLWKLYGMAFKGSRQLVWSPGLKDLSGVSEVSDEIAAENETQEEQTQELVAHISAEDWEGNPGWLGARERRARILDAAERFGAAGVDAVVADGGGEDGSDGGGADGPRKRGAVRPAPEDGRTADGQADVEGGGADGPRKRGAVRPAPEDGRTADGQADVDGGGADGPRLRGAVRPAPKDGRTADGQADVEGVPPYRPQGLALELLRLVRELAPREGFQGEERPMTRP